MDKYTVTKSIKKLFVTVSAVAVIGTAFIGGQSAFAAGTAITGGELSMLNSVPSDFAPVKLDGTVQTTKADLSDFTVTDARGTGAGWNVMVSATQLEDTAAGLKIPTGSIKISAPDVTAQAGASDVESTITIGSGMIDTDTGVKLLSAKVDGGMGKYDVAFPTEALTMTLNPKDVKAGNYTSTITVTLTTGP